MQVILGHKQPKSATKGEFFHLFLSLIVSSWRHGLQMANEADEVLLGKRPRQEAAAIKNHGKCTEKTAI